jgi:hypothetical protein
MTQRRLAALSTDTAYRVPWHFERGEGAGMYGLRNLGVERLSGVTFNLYGSGAARASAEAALEPGDVLELVITGLDLARTTVGIVRWLRPNGDEYLWRLRF